MSHPTSPTPSLFFCGCLWSSRERMEACAAATEAVWGPILERSADFPFEESRYYDAEMGAGLKRTFFLYRQPMRDPAVLVERKEEAAHLERRYAWEGRRTVNLDPGYLNRHQVVIATFKDFAHRIYLGKGVYAHLEYLFRNGETALLPWTYPDFRRNDHRTLFQSWRRRVGENILRLFPVDR